jgi:hypothetical protein
MARAAGLGKQDGAATVQVLEQLAGVNVGRLTPGAVEAPNVRRSF